MLRAREVEVVREVFGRHFKLKLQYENAAKLFLSRLKGVTDPERKRKIIGKAFIEVFQAATKRAGKAKFLAQGTLYPGRDRIRAHRGQSRRAHQESSQRGRVAQEHEVSTRRAAEMFVQG